MMPLKNIAFLITVFLSVDLHANVVFTLTEAQGNLVVSTESGDFGTAPAVVIHDDFDSGPIGQPLQNWNVATGSGTQNPSYSDYTSVTGKQSGMASFLGGNYNSSAEYKNLPDLDTAYLSYYFRVELLSGLPSRNIKLARLSGGHSGGVYVQAAGITFYDMHSNGQFQQASIDFADSKVKSVWTSDHVDNKWHRMQQYIKLSNPPKEANGITIAKLNGQEITNQVNIVNEETGMRYKWLTLPYYVAHDQGGDYKIYYDNVVVSKNRARVELCENDSYNDCKQPVIAKTVSWSPKSITIAKESLSLTKPYIFIFNENDSIVGKAIHYCPNCPSKPKTSP